VLADGVVVGRIMKAAAAPEGTPCLWTLAYGQHKDRTRRTAMRRRARPRWRRSLRVGGGCSSASIRPDRFAFQIRRIRCIHPNMTRPIALTDEQMDAVCRAARPPLRRGEDPTPETC
jgi:hypothetical protein